MAYYKIFRFIKNVFVVAMTFFSCSVLNVSSLMCISMNNQECKIRPQIINFNIDNYLFYPYNVKTNN